MGRHVINSTGSITISTAHAGCDIYATGGQTTITFSSAIVDCDVRIINGDGGNGKILAGLSSDVNPKLYPNQAISVNSDGSIWFATEKPGRWRIPHGTIVFVNPNSSVGNDANDGLTLTTPLQHIGFAGKVCLIDFDACNVTAIIAPITGQTYINDELFLNGQPTGSNLLQISPYGGGSFTWQCDGPCIGVGDNSELDIRIDQFGSSNGIVFAGNRLNATLTGHIYQHNNGLIDMEGSAIFSGSGSNDCAFFFDGPCPGASIANGFQVEGSFDTIFRMDEGGGRYTIGGTVGPVAGTAPAANRLFAILGCNELIQSATLVNGGYSTLGPSVVGGNALFLNVTGAAVPGGISATQGGRIETTKW